MRKKRDPAGIAVVSAVVLFAATAALADAPDNYQIRLNPADQAAARATVLRRVDLTNIGGVLDLLPAKKWTGGAEKPDLSPDDSPPACNPKESDLVLTGVAKSKFTNERVGLAGLVTLTSEVQVLQTARMVQLDWRRSFDRPNLAACGRRELLSSIKDGFLKGMKPKLRSWKRVNYPKTMRFPVAFVAVIDLTVKGKAASLVGVTFIQYKGRTEVHLAGGAFSPKADIAEAEVLLFIHELTPILVGRARV